MTSISSIATTRPQTPPPPPRRAGGEDPMAAVADKLGLSSNDLKSQLGDGKSLDDIATAQGVSHEDLISAIRSTLPDDATRSAEKIAGTKGMPPPPPGGGPGGPDGPGGPGGPKGQNTGIQDSAKLGEVSKLLKMDDEEVSAQASSATDLVKLLQSRGVDLGQLRSVLNNGDLLDVAA